MHTDDPLFLKMLSVSLYQAENFITYSASQIERNDHLKNDPSIGERAWSIPETTGRFLYALIIKTGTTRVLELGTSIGYSTLWIASGLDQNTKDFSLITIEKNPVKSQIANDILSSTFPTITFQTGMIHDHLNNLSLETPFDIIFMDADRGNYRVYWDSLEKMLHKKSIVVIDNALRDQKSVFEFQDFLKSNPHLSTYLYTIDNGLFIVTLSDGDYNNIAELFSEI